MAKSTKKHESGGEELQKIDIESVSVVKPFVIVDAALPVVLKFT